MSANSTSANSAAANRSENERARNRGTQVVEFILLPTVFLLVALLGGVRIEAGTSALRLLPPPLIALVLAALLTSVFARARLVRIGGWLSETHAPVVNVAHALMLASLYAAAAQAFNSVLPERGLLHGLFAFFFLWTLWNNLFTRLDAREALRSVAVLFATAFAIKHFLLASLFGAERSTVERIAAALVEGVSLNLLSAPSFAPATGYISFFALALFIFGLWLMPRAPVDAPPASDVIGETLDSIARLTSAERRAVGELLRRDERIAAGGTNERAADAEIVIDADR